jgi:hypothetical protein
MTGNTKTCEFCCKWLQYPVSAYWQFHFSFTWRNNVLSTGTLQVVLVCPVSYKGNFLGEPQHLTPRSCRFLLLLHPTECSSNVVSHVSGNSKEYNIHAKEKSTAPKFCHRDVLYCTCHVPLCIREIYTVILSNISYIPLSATQTKECILHTTISGKKN